jgi:hypothetical protein
MSSVFASSHVALAATDSANPHGGLYLDDFPTPFRIPTDSAASQALIRIRAATGTVVGSHLNSRAWVLQEMILSRRTVHLSKRQLYWQCHSATKSEDGTTNTKSMDTLAISYIGDGVKDFNLSNAVSNRQYRWLCMKNYCTRQLS